jgi:putative ABC transport system substrate-binding protein
MQRREFVTLLGGAVAAAWPVAALAQQPDRVRRIGVLMNLTADNPQGKPQIAAFLEALQQLGWSDGRNVRIDIRWGTNDIDRQRGYAAELAALIPDVILASGTLSVVALQHVTRTLPIVFVRVVDPVGAASSTT